MNQMTPSAESRRVRFDELDYPDCSQCHAKRLNAHSARLDEDGYVLRVLCLDCNDTENLDRYSKDGRLFSSLTLSACLKAYKGGKPGTDPRWLKIDASSKIIHTAAKAPGGFECHVWFNGLQRAVRDSGCTDMSSGKVLTPIGDLTLVTFCSAGRCVLQIDSDVARLTLITAEDEDEARMGVRGIDATEEQALELLATIVAAWKHGKIVMQDDTKNGIG